MDNLPVISVVTVTMNDYAGLLRTAESIADQNYAAIQHVVVDGGSSDGSAEWLHDYKPKCDVIALSEPDGGIFDAMNKGAKLSTGELLIFMNSADIFAGPSVLSSVAENWAKTQWDWAYGQLEYLTEDLISKGQSTQSTHSQRAIELGTRFAPHQATFMTTKFFRALGGFNLTFEYACDQELALRAGRKSEPVVFDRVIAKFLLGGTHSQTTYWRREMIYHRMRLQHSALVGNGVFLDRIYTFAMAAYREARQLVAKYVHATGRKLGHARTP